MKRRTYQIYEVWANYGQDDQSLIARREDLEIANRLAEREFHIRGYDKIYVLRVEVVNKLERDEND